MKESDHDIRSLLRATYPELDDEQLARAEQNLEEYVRLMIRIEKRIEDETLEPAPEL